MFDLVNRRQLKRDYQEAFSTEHGKRVLAHILKVAGVTRPRFTSDNQQTRINEGERRLAMSIFNFVHSTSDRLLDLIEEEVRKDQENE